jgi:hypothetical protein
MLCNTTGRPVTRNSAGLHRHATCGTLAPGKFGAMTQHKPRQHCTCEELELTCWGSIGSKQACKATTLTIGLFAMCMLVVASLALCGAPLRVPGFLPLAVFMRPAQAL